MEPATHTVVLEPRLDIGASFSKTVVRLEAGEQRRLDFGVPFEWPRLRGSLRTRAGGAPHQGAIVHAHGAGTPSASARSEVGPDGAFELRAVASGVGSLRIDVLPAAVELEVEVDVRAP